MTDNESTGAESLGSYSLDDEDQLQAEDTLDDRGVEDLLDEGFSPPERPRGVDAFGTIAAEQHQGESIEQRLAHEVPDPTNAFTDPLADSDRGIRAVSYEKGTAMNQLRSLLGIAGVSSTLLVGGATGVALAGATKAAPAGTGTSPSVCYEVENQFGRWMTKDQGCDGKVVAPSGGVRGISITVNGVKQVLYSVSPDGVTFSSGDNGDKLNSGKKTMQLKAELSPRLSRHLEYTVTYDDPANNTEVERTKSDNQVVGDGKNVFNTISFKITHD